MLIQFIRKNFPWDIKTCIYLWFYAHNSQINCNPISDCVLGAGFSGLYFKEESQEISLKTTQTISTFEKLKKDDQVWVSIGRRKLGSALNVDTKQPAVFSIKLVAEQELFE